MAGLRWPPPPEDHWQQFPVAVGAGAAVQSDEERSSVAADSWSVKSDFGSSTIDLRAASDYSSDKEAPDSTDVETLQNFCDATYAEDLANFQEHGHAGELCFGSEVLDVLVRWTKDLCLGGAHQDLSTCSVLDVGTGNGRLLQELSKQGFNDLTGIDFSEAAIEVARNLANREGFPHVNFLVDDVLETKLEKKFQLVLDKGTLDAIALHPDGPVKRMMYWESVSRLVAPGGILIITSCSSTKDELVQEMDSFNHRKSSSVSASNGESSDVTSVFQYLDHVQNYPHFVSSGVQGSRVATVAFVAK
ncbi:hypothetical protein LUZ61_004475 [Rhynchospora tenuis]|uniref:Protein-lysine N-methyltransferase LUZ61_004475 n=1 Tax=Rhynchospora tenuis TaxID=198213 RepID=A0AAD5ZMY4_9POAL|nr:hypothetical protein LUZ61_004475 [Rhynchospora tenuis]